MPTATASYAGWIGGNPASRGIWVATYLSGNPGLEIVIEIRNEG